MNDYIDGKKSGYIEDQMNVDIGTRFAPSARTLEAKLQPTPQRRWQPAQPDRMVVVGLALGLLLEEWVLVL